MTHTTPGHVGDVQQTVDAAQIDEGAVVGDVLDGALDDGAFGQGLEQLGALFTLREFDHGTTRQHDVVALAIELDDLEVHRLALEGRGVLDRAHVNQRAGQEGANAVGHDREAALHLAGDGAIHEFAVFQGALEVDPGSQALGAVARQTGFAVAVFQ